MTTKKVLLMVAKLWVAWALLLAFVALAMRSVAQVAEGVLAASRMVGMPPAEVAGVGLGLIVLALAVLWMTKLDDRQRHRR